MGSPGVNSPAPAAGGHAGVRAFRILADHQGDLLRVCKFGFSASDGSLYLFPYGLTGTYFFGRHVIPAGRDQSTARFDDQERSSIPPKLSIHESGRVHVRAQGREAGPMMSHPLWAMRGEHVAAVTCSRFAGLSPFPRTPRSSGPEQDIVVPVGSGVESGRLVVYANAKDPAFILDRGVTVTLTRPTLPRALYVCVAPVSQLPLNEETEDPAVVIIAGWDPLDPKPLSEAAEYLFIVAR